MAETVEERIAELDSQLSHIAEEAEITYLFDETVYDLLLNDNPEEQEALEAYREEKNLAEDSNILSLYQGFRRGYKAHKQQS